MSTNTTVPPIPYKSPLSDQNGIVSPVWAKWLNQIFLKTGGTSSTSLTSLETTVANQAIEITAINTTLTSLQSQINGLGVGRDL